MAHYAFLDANNLVTQVITGLDETVTIDGLNTETWYANFKGQVCKRTSYNGNIRFNYAGIGYFYDEVADAFIPPKPSCEHDELQLTDDFNWSCNHITHVYLTSGNN